ncbi:HlyD family type I secretion periplasmic adaptor subunit [Methylobacterium currus]|uniref:Membrane fusion protein (MFP) family protein n=2 Tax=Methylobacterium currus TaxID=2051553 RepID=A0A2R4WT93_9HYPH|nr:HlyD family type I secretion periplasmic adaptor subunit [Methylobacterium currus]AWB24767.1 HlyD family type I secretion periplasmic adaptor subunit [Methylobacterium currus]
MIGGSAVATLLIFGLGGWAATTDLAGAVIAPGVLVVETNVKKVQHPTGGVVGELRVREGTTVRAGEILVRLDETVTRANLTVVTKGQDEFTARQSRLKAEQNGQDIIHFPDEMMQRIGEPSIASLLGEEKRLFEIRRTARDGQKLQLKERISQLREQIQGMTDQVRAKQREIDLIGEELKGVRDLFAKNLIQIARVTALERDAARLVGERGALISSIAQIRGKVTETELQILQVEQDLRTEVGRELAEIRGKLAELVEKRVAAEDQLKRVEIRAPQDGVVHQLTIHTVGGVISPGEQLMLIVPRAEALTIEAKIQPHDVDQVRIGNKAVLRFSAFNQRTTPEVAGRISMVAADISHDQKTGASFYTVRIQPASDDLKRLHNLQLVAGMPVESFIQTGERTVISYLVKPLADQAAKAWRER